MTACIRKPSLWIMLLALLSVGALAGLWIQQGHSQGMRGEPFFLGPPGSPPWYEMDPELVPDYLLWREFFDSVVLHGEFGDRSFTILLGDRVGLEEADALRVLEIAQKADALRRQPSEGDPELQLEQRVRYCKRAYYELEESVDPQVFAAIEDFVTGEFRYSFKVLEEDSARERRISAIHHTFSELTRQDAGAEVGR